MCEDMNNKHSVLHQTGLIPQPETPVIGLVYAVAIFFSVLKHFFCQINKFIFLKCDISVNKRVAV